MPAVGTISVWFAAIEGFAIGGSLIIAIGAQNAYVIRQGVRGEYVFLAATICAFSDAILVSIGVAGVGTMIASNPVLRSVAAWGGGAFLLIYGTQAGLRLFKPPQETIGKGKSSGKTAITVAATALAFTYLNPHVYLDTVILIGGIAAQFDSVSRIWFGAGAISASIVWFYSIAYGATRMAPFLQTKFGSRLLDGVIAMVMWTVAISLIKSEI